MGKQLELEEKILGFKEKMRLLEDSIVNGIELQVKDATGLEVGGGGFEIDFELKIRNCK